MLSATARVACRIILRTWLTYAKIRYVSFFPLHLFFRLTEFESIEDPLAAKTLDLPGGVTFVHSGSGMLDPFGRGTTVHGGPLDAGHLVAFRVYDRPFSRYTFMKRRVGNDYVAIERSKVIGIRRGSFGFVEADFVLPDGRSATCLLRFRTAKRYLAIPRLQLSLQSSRHSASFARVAARRVDRWADRQGRGGRVGR